MKRIKFGHYVLVGILIFNFCKCMDSSESEKKVELKAIDIINSLGGGCSRCR